MIALEQARQELAAEWRQKKPKNREEIGEFYRHSMALQGDLDAWHATPERQEWSLMLFGAIEASRARRILDVGCGAGHDLAFVLSKKPSLDCVGVEPNIELRVAAARRMVIPVFPSIDAVDQGLFDLINCIDVLEHVPDPDGLLMEIIERTHLRSIIVEATATHDISTPLHLPHLRGWSPARLLDRYGFELREERGRLRIWERVASKRGDEPSALVCAYRSLTVDTAQALTDLIKTGWRHKFHRGDALISRVRSIAVSQWLREDDGDVFLMFDDDIVFRPDEAARVVALAREKKGIACAAYPVRGGSHLALRTLEQGELRFGPDLEPIEVRWAGTGFIAAHRSVCEAIAATMPLCHPDNLQFWPMFQPVIYTTEAPDGEEVSEYLSEDWAFCERARRLGFQVWLDRTVELTHLGEAAYTVRTMKSAVVEA